MGKFLCIDCHPASSLKLGITASGRYGPSHERNRFKRLVREAFRHSFAQLPQHLELNVVPRQFAKKATYCDIHNDLVLLLTKTRSSFI